MKNIIRNQRKSERGVALLFAIGILSLLLLLGLAFTTNALLARKVAFNNSSRTQAKMLAQSAISRAALSIMFYQEQAEFQTDAAKKFWPTEFTNIYSYDEVATGSGDKAVQDQLDYSDNNLNKLYSKLNYQDNVLEYNGWEDSDAHWAFLYNKSSGTTGDPRKIIGRIAYQALPTVTSTRLTMSHVLLGSSSSVDAWAHRQGKDTNELFMDATEAFTTDAGLHWGDFEPDSDALQTYDALYAAYGPGSEHPEQIFFPKAEAEDPALAWVKRWLSEGDKASVYEAFEIEDGGKIKKYNRFNLSSEVNSSSDAAGKDPWYWRFFSGSDTGSSTTLPKEWTDWLNANSNNEDAVENLAEEATEFKELAKYSPHSSGLPFLKQIGNDKGSFDTIDDLRKQIAANLNDYCDADFIPTSDIDAVDWMSLASTTATGSLPTYTGNEKDYYINEVAMTFEATPSLENGSAAPFASSPVQAKLTLEPRFLLELIDIYNLDNQELFFRTGLKSMDFELQATIDGELKYTDPDTMTSQTINLTDVTLDTPATLSVPAKDIQIDFSTDSAATGARQSGYRAKSVEISFDPKLELTADFTSKFLAEWNGITTGKTFNSARITKIRFEITSLKYEFAPLVLSRNISPVDDSATMVETGVDFVKFPTGTIPSSDTLPQLTLELFTNTTNTDEDGNFTIAEGSTDFPDLTVKEKTFVLGGMEVYDPRQNLNAREYNTTTGTTPLTALQSDWYLNPQLVTFADFSTAVSMTIPDSTTETGTPDYTTMTGNVNSQSNPSSPGEMGGSTDFDQELATDPAWLGDSDSQHISTAFIRNEPMESPWELGAIHRAQAWRTINLKDARSGGDDWEAEDFTNSNSWNDPDGTSYAEGDGAILEQIKMTAQNRCFGKLDINMLIEQDNDDYVEGSADTPSDKDMVRALFTNLSHGRGFLNIDSAPPDDDDSWVASVADAVCDRVKDATNRDGEKFQSRTQFLCYRDSSTGNGLLDGFGLLDSADMDTDANQEEIIGKTINLLGCKGSELPNTVQLLIVAQSIRDVGGDGTALQITKLRHDGTPITHGCRLGQFDYDDDSSAPSDSPDQWIYFDEITGEVKLLVTLDRDPSAGSGRLTVRKIEYLE